ncbi:thiol:disulfide interchange protein [Frateuria aurantia DSM 6220]|uniref:Thiol:disulfide interchange protein n=2 Tax=Frateuria aurantia TaxID=81475 RepID=H8KYU6_FRAAD|nr:thiol:disulfide interchange protein [Frateuria aurantia DSM 6220]
MRGQGWTGIMRRPGRWLGMLLLATVSCLQAQGVENLLPVTEAYRLSADTSTPGVVKLHWVIAPDYYLYRGQMRFTGTGPVTLGTVTTATGHRYRDAYLGEVETYHVSTDARVEYSASAEGGELVVRYQGCHEVDPKICYPPHSQRFKLPPAKAAAMIVPAAGAAEGRSASHDPEGAAGDGSAVKGDGFWLVMLLAVAGGMLLNLMPCVLPILFLKLGGLIRHGGDRRRAIRSSLGYGLGVMTSFVALGVLVIELRHAGAAVGWGLQLQQPWLLGALACVMFAMGLAMSGIIELGSGLARLGDGLARRPGVAGDFFSGVLAVVVASPCTAPMMGTALAYALVAPLAQALAVFVALGFGLALPYLLLSLWPGLSRRLPRPGRWMDTLKQLLAFPMYLSVIWLVWVLARQRGADAVALALLAMTAVAFGLWVWRRGREWPRWRLLWLLPLGAAVVMPLVAVGRLAPPAVDQALASDEVAYDAARLQKLVAAGTPVFVDMTADWCITCKANEHVVLAAPAFRELMRQSGAVYMKGDWTDVDPAISRFLEHYHSPGVPLYVVFGPRRKDGVVLPTVLNMSVLAAAFKQARG